MYTINTETNNLIAKELVQLLMDRGNMYALGYLEGMIKTEMDQNVKFREVVLQHMLSQKRRAA